MSFRELRNFTVYLRYLGYPKHISKDQFQNPDFQSVATILKWLLERLDPNADLHLDLETPSERVEFVQNAAKIAWDAGEIRLNLRNLYSADRYAVKELLKIAHVLYRAVQLTQQPIHMHLDPMQSSDQSSLRSSRNLGTALVTNGARLHELLGEESKNRPARNAVVSFLDEMAYNLESNEPQKRIEQAVMRQIENFSHDVERLKMQIQSCEVDEKNLQKKLSRKTQEFERANKQLQNLKAMEHAKKLPFMAEKMELEAELKELTSVYIQTYRNLSWLDAEVANYREKELLEKAEADRRLKRMQKKMREEQRRLLKGDHTVDLEPAFGEEESSSSENSELNPGKGRTQNRPSSRRMNFREMSSDEESLAGHRARLSENDSEGSELEDMPEEDDFDFDSAESNF